MLTSSTLSNISDNLIKNNNINLLKNNKREMYF